jgi:hypothetical protein
VALNTITPNLRLIAEIITNVYLYQLLAVRGVGNDAEIENNSDIK